MLLVINMKVLFYIIIILIIIIFIMVLVINFYPIYKFVRFVVLIECILAQVKRLTFIRLSKKSFKKVSCKAEFQRSSHRIWQKSRTLAREEKDISLMATASVQKATRRPKAETFFKFFCFLSFVFVFVVVVVLIPLGCLF